jgi:hypothetical protein
MHLRVPTSRCRHLCPRHGHGLFGITSSANVSDCDHFAGRATGLPRQRRRRRRRAGCLSSEQSIGREVIRPVVDLRDRPWRSPEDRSAPFATTALSTAWLAMLVATRDVGVATWIIDAPRQHPDSRGGVAWWRTSGRRTACRQRSTTALRSWPHGRRHGP